MSAPDVSILAPCYNEEAVLPELYRRVSEVCRSLGKSYEIVLVNDGSRDRTWEMLQELSRKDPALVAVNLSRNHGHQLALSAGLAVVRGKRILVIDADLQDPPELLPQMLEVMDRGADVVYAQRRSRPGDSIPKRISCAIFYRLLDRVSSVPIPLDSGDFRLMSRRTVDIINSMPERHRFIRGMVSWIGFKQEPFLYDRDARFAGETKYPLTKLVKLALDGVTSFSIRPLRVAMYMSLAVAGFAGLLLVYAVVSLLVGHTPPGDTEYARRAILAVIGHGPPPGWTSIMAAIAILGSAQMLLLGIIGEYLGRLYEQGKGRPMFIIERVVRGGEPGEIPGAPTKPV